MVSTWWNKFQSFTEKKKQILCLFHAFNPSWEKLYQNLVQFFSVIPCGIALPYSNALQYYVKRKKCKVNDVIFPSCCEARAINLGNKNMKIGIFTGGTSVRSKNFFTDISRYSTRKHEIKAYNEWSAYFTFAKPQSSLSSTQDLRTEGGWFDPGSTNTSMPSQDLW